MTTTATTPPVALRTSDSLRTIAARLVLHADSQLDGRMVLALAEDVARMESRLADVDECEEDYLQALNDFLIATQERVNRITAKRTRAADGPNGKAGSALCAVCGLPRAVHEHCPKCGYTYCDCQYHMDHHLCGQPMPKQPMVSILDKLESDLKSIKDSANEIAAGDPPAGYAELAPESDAVRIADECYRDGMNAMETALRNWIYDQRQGS